MIIYVGSSIFGNMFNFTIIIGSIIGAIVTLTKGDFVIGVLSSFLVMMITHIFLYVILIFLETSGLLIIQ
jgi:hypothetical protein